MPALTVEPWLRGLLPGLNPVAGHLIRASQQIREDVAGALDALTVSQLWSTPCGMTSAGFHAKHLAGSTARLCAYLEGRELSAAEVGGIANESTGSEAAADLMARVNAAFDRYDSLVVLLDESQFGAIRQVGRKRLETTAISLAIHIAEHGQRHAGQAISASKLIRSGVSVQTAPPR